VIRFGGEEFFFLLVDINPGDAIVVAEKIRKIFDEAEIKILNGSIHKTLILGVSEFSGDGEGYGSASNTLTLLSAKLKTPVVIRLFALTKRCGQAKIFDLLSIDLLRSPRCKAGALSFFLLHM
jgi:hypothetical protein